MVEWKKLGEIVVFRNGKGHEKIIIPDGKYIVVNSKFISSDGSIKKYCNEQISPLYVDDILMVMSDVPNGKAIAKCYLVERNNLYTLNQRIGAFHVCDSNVITKYLFYVINRNEQLLQYDNKIDQTNLKKDDILNITIPLPPLQEQQRIVSILDTFEASIQNLEAQLKQREKQYEYYRDQLLDLEGKPEVEMKMLGEICKVTDYVANGSFATLRENVSYRQEPDYAILVRTTDLSNNFKGDKVYIDERAYTFLSKSSLFGGEIIINNIGAGVGQTFKCPYLKERMSLGPNSIMVKTPNNDYFYYYFNSIYGQNAMMKVVTPGAMPKFNKTGFKTITIPVPSLHEQQRIVSILDTFEASIQNLEAQLKQRENQYEYYRNKLLTFE